MKLVFETILAPAGQGRYTIEVPSLQGCISEGNSLDHSIEMAIEAASIWILDELEDGSPIPKARATTKNDLSHFDNPIVRTIEVDIESFARKHASQVVVRSFEIPAWLDTLAGQNQIDLTKAIETAIIQSAQ
jgi:predicted RNase H-like HicB family nuclease